VFWFFPPKIFAWSISHSKTNWAKRTSVFMSGTLLFLADINETLIFSTDFPKYPNIRLHKNPPSGSRVVPHGRTEITKLIVAFRNSANAPTKMRYFNPLKPELKPICYLLALLRSHHFLHVSRIRVKLLTFRLLMSYTYGAPILDVSRSHTTTQHSR